jgi:hypothetical protein
MNPKPLTIFNISAQPKAHGGGLGKSTPLGRFLVEEFFFMTQRQRAHPKSGICSHFQQLLVLRKDVGRISY